MEIKKLFGQESVQSANAVRRQKDVTTQDAQGGSSTGRGDDVVSFSPLAKQLSQVSSILADDEQTRSKRIADIKGSVQNGTYSVRSSDVARSLVSYAGDQPSTVEQE